MAFLSGPAAVAFLLGRLAFGLVLAFMGLNHFLNADQLVPYAEAKGIPAPGAAVLGSGATLAVGGVAVAAGAFPVVGAALIVLFFLGVTPTMHDFWNADEEDVQTEMTQFLKNVVMTGGALAVLAVGGVEWPYALNVGLFL